MTFKTKWSNWWVFGISSAAAIISTPFVASLYFDFFRSYGGGLLGFPDEFESYPLTFMFLYTLFITFFHVGFARNPKFLTVLYFTALPFFFFMTAGGDRLLAGFILLIVGAIIGYGVRQLGGNISR